MKRVKEERNVLCIWTRQTTCVVQRRGRRTFRAFSSNDFWIPFTGRASLASGTDRGDFDGVLTMCAFAAQAMRTAWARAEEDEGGQIWKDGRKTDR
jgi:hypothetical protein